MKTALIVVLGLILCGCSGGGLKSAAPIITVVATSAVVQAGSTPPCTGFTKSNPAGEVIDQGDGVYFVNAEVSACAGNAAQGNLFYSNFTLPPNGTVTSFEGSISFRTNNCVGQSLSAFIVDGKHHPIAIQKIRYGGGEPSNEQVSRHTPMKYSAGIASIEVATDIACYDPTKPNTVEIQGLLKVN